MRDSHTTTQAPRSQPTHTPIPPPPPPQRARPLRAPPISYTEPSGPTTVPSAPPPALSFPFGSQDGVGVAPSTHFSPDNDAGLGLFGIHPKRSTYHKLAKYRHLFARKGDYICSTPLQSFCWTAVHLRRQHARWRYPGVRTTLNGTATIQERFH